MWAIHTKEYYSVLKRKEIQTHTAIWMDHEDIMLSEIHQRQKEKYCLIPLIGANSTESTFTETENRLVITRGLGRGKWEVSV